MYLILGIGSVGLLIYLFNNTNSSLIYNVLNIFTKIESQCMDVSNYFRNNKIKIDAINDSFSIINYIIKNKCLKQIINLNDGKKYIFDENNIENYLTYKSPIIGCHICIIEKEKQDKQEKEKQEVETDITELFNGFVLYNCKLILSNEIKYKKLWIDILNKYSSTNIIYNDNLIIKWKIIHENINIYESQELIINVDNGKFNINLE